MSKPNQPKSQIDRLRSSFHGSHKKKGTDTADPSIDFNSEDQSFEDHSLEVQILDNQPLDNPSLQDPIEKDRSLEDQLSQDQSLERQSSENQNLKNKDVDPEKASSGAEASSSSENPSFTETSSSSSSASDVASNSDSQSEAKKQPKKQSLLSGFLTSASMAKKKKTSSKSKGKPSNEDGTCQDIKPEPETPDEKMLKALKKEQKRIRGKKTYWKTLVNTICVLVLISSLSVLAATLWLPFLKVYTNTMAPSVNKDDIVMVVKKSHLEPGELIGFYYNNKLMIKRVIAQAGDVVDIDDNGIVYVNGSPLDEPYVSNQQRGDASIDFPYTVPEAQLFVLSDDRSNLLDSRNYAIQSIAEELILGKIALRVWPVSNLRVF